MILAHTKSADDTKEMAAALATVLRPGDLVLLSGELGAGKTTLVQGLGRALGVDEPMTSPTFTLMRDYDARIPLVHVDVYRLDHLQEVLDLGIAELIDDEAVALIEWGDLAEPVLPADFCEVRLSYTDTEGDEDDARDISIRLVGSRWAARADALAGAIDRWVVRP